MEIGKDYQEGPEDSPHPNRWPESLPEFKAFMVSSRPPSRLPLP